MINFSTIPKNLFPIIVHEIVHDQHFLIDQKVLQQIISAAKINPKDIVLEIGAGKGALTLALAKQAQKVIAIELDERFKAELKNLPKNVEVIFGNALDILPKRKDFNKLIANIPYQICEPLLHYLCTAKNVEMSILTISKKFALNARQHPIFSAFLNLETIQEVPKEAFQPAPKVVSALVKITPNLSDDDNNLIRRKLYLQRDKKLKNGLRDALIDLFRKKGRELTKKQAGEIVDSLKLPSSLLENTSAKLSLNKYKEIAEKLSKC
ncbi:MAG: rRNA adenine N-6-methyltransferase family protein [Nanoarchaeota archaeon]